MLLSFDSPLNDALFHTRDCASQRATPPFSFQFSKYQANSKETGDILDRVQILTKILEAGKNLRVLESAVYLVVKLYFGLVGGCYEKAIAEAVLTSRQSLMKQIDKLIEEHRFLSYEEGFNVSGHFPVVQKFTLCPLFTDFRSCPCLFR